MNIQYMEYFVATAEKGCISEAAAGIYITSQGLNKALRKVEAEYGPNLFYFSGGKFCLTAAGENVYNCFKSILELNNNLLNSIASTHSDEDDNETISVFCSPIFTDTLIPKVCASLKQSFPSVKLKVIEHSIRKKFSVPDMINSSSLFLFGAESSKLDALCRSMPAFNLRKDIIQTELLASVSEKSPLANQTVLNSEHFLEHDLVLCRMEDYFLTKVAPCYSFNQIITKSILKRFCLQTLSSSPNAIGFSNILESYYHGDYPLVYIPVDPSIELKYGYLACEDYISAPAYSALLSAVEEELEKINRSKSKKTE